MGIPKLNKLLMERCPKSIKKVNLETLINKKVAVDISIYLYKFITDGDYMEHLYLFLSLFKYYCIIPVFVFDGKPPPEKYALLKKRYSEKQQASIEYKSLEKLMEETEDEEKIQELERSMNTLRKKMVRITGKHIEQAIELMNAFGFQHYFAPSEADQLCVYLTTSGKTYATMSDDMDMIVSGCSIVLRNLSMLNHEVYMYDTVSIMEELGIPLKEFREIVVLSGTDYELNEKSSNINIRKAFDLHKQYKESLITDPEKDEDKHKDFYEWLTEMKGIKTVDLYKIAEILNIDTHAKVLEEFIKAYELEKPKFSVSTIKQIMSQYKFIFI